MIVNWKKENAGALVLPCIKGKVLIKNIFILPGFNDVKDEDWFLARISKNVQRKIERGDLEEVVREKSEKILRTVEKQMEESVDLLTVENLPWAPVVKAIKELGLYDVISDIKKEETEVKNLTKEWLVDYFKKETDQWFEVESLVKQESLEKAIEEEPSITSIALQDLDTNKATDIIADTWNLTTLEKWKKEVAQPDLRVLILNQIEEVNKPPRPGDKK